MLLTDMWKRLLKLWNMKILLKTMTFNMKKLI